MRKITLKDKYSGKTISFNGQLIGEQPHGKVYQNHDSGGYVIKDNGHIEEYPGNSIWKALDQYHPKHACPGGPTERELIYNLLGTMLLLDDAAKKDPFLEAMLDASVYKGVVNNYLNNEAGV